MTNSFRKHHTTIMWVVIAGTIISFTAYLTPSMRSGGGGGGGSGPVAGTVDGENISQSEFDSAKQEARVFLRMRTGKWPAAGAETAQQLTGIAWQHLFISAKLKELNLDIPDAAIKAGVRRAFGLQPGQALDKSHFDDFVKTELNDHGKVELEDFEHYIRDTVAVELLLRLYGVNGELITSKEAEFFFRRFHESMGIELARFPVSNYTNHITATPQELGAFYTNQQANYRLPDREQVNYIFFNVTNYLTNADTIIAGMSNLDLQIDQQYMSRDAATYKDTNGNQMTADAAKAKIKDEFRLQVVARNVAQTNSIQLAQLFFKSHKSETGMTNPPITRDDLQKFATSNSLTLVTTPPFDRTQLPPELSQILPQAREVIFSLELGEPDDQFKFLPATNGFFLVGLERKIPSENQPYDVVRAKVTEDYIKTKAESEANMDGAKFEAAAKVGLAKGDTFDAICAEQKVKPVVLTPFTLDTTSIPEIPEQNVFEYIDRIVYELPVGQISPYQPNVPGGGFVAYVKSRTPVDDAIVQRDIPPFLDDQRQKRQVAAFSVWLGRQMQSAIKENKAPAEGGSP